MTGWRLSPGHLSPRHLSPGHDDQAAPAAEQQDAEQDAGRAMIEVVFLAVLLLIPTVYILASVMRIQAATFAVSQAARDAGRVIDSAPTVTDGVARP